LPVQQQDGVLVNILQLATIPRPQPDVNGARNRLPELKD